MQETLLRDPRMIEGMRLLEERARQQARESFWAYRQYMNPTMKRGWWQREVAHHLQRFAEDLMAGTAPMLAIAAPPQHGKSHQIIDLVSWMAGKWPRLKAIYGSYSDRLGVRANLRLQRTYDSQRYQDLFSTRINSRSMVTAARGYQRNREIIEYVDEEGFFRNVTVLGGVTGDGLDLGIVDDPIKGRAEARSKAVRDKTWDWLTDDFMTRFSEEAGLLMIMTSWHVDDPLGRMASDHPEMRILRYPALARFDELHRSRGEPLFPELKSLEFIERRRGLMTKSNFEALYQQDPKVANSGMFPVDRISMLDHLPMRSQVKRAVRYWDKAGTKDDGAYTSGVLMLELIDGRFFVAHVYRKQVDFWTRESDIRRQAELDSATWNQVDVYIEQEPGSGGKESAQRTIANLAGHVIRADRPVGDKELRAEPYAVQVQAGNVCILSADWTQAYLDELEDFPGGKYKDQADASAGAFAKLTDTGGKRAGALY